MEVGYLGVVSEIPGVLAASGASVRVLAAAPTPAEARRLDVLLVAGWGLRLPSDRFSAPRLGTLNVHPSLLPARRGPEPLRWAILEGDERFGVTVHQMTDAIDAGPILWQTDVPARPLDTHTTMLRSLLASAATALPGVLGALSAGSLVGRSQDEARASVQPRVPRALLRLDPTMDAPSVCRRIAADSDRAAILVGPVAAVRFVQAAVLDVAASSRRPGEVLGVEGRRVAFATARGSLLAVASEAPRLRRGDLLRAQGLS